MKLYYIQPKSSYNDIVFWPKDIKVGKKPLGCLAFFYEKEFAMKYIEYLNENDEHDIEYGIKNIVIKQQDD